MRHKWKLWAEGSADVSMWSLALIFKFDRYERGLIVAVGPFMFALGIKRD